MEAQGSCFFVLWDKVSITMEKDHLWFHRYWFSMMLNILVY